MSTESCTLDFFVCKWCDSNFISASALVHHSLSIHGNGVPAKSDETNSQQQLPSKNKKKKSSLNKKALKCQNCDRKFRKKITFVAHLKLCNTDLADSKNNVNNNILPNTHQSDSITSSQHAPIKCNVCCQPFSVVAKLRFHIRRHHFNLKAKLPYCLQKKVNQVWFENVLNCKNVMEIKKAGPNKLVMRKLDEKSAIKVIDNKTEEVDVSDLYPVRKSYQKIKCVECFKEIAVKSFKKHVENEHKLLISAKNTHHCSQCGEEFEEEYKFLQHACHRVMR